jgi:hypothetical protein
MAKIVEAYTFDLIDILILNRREALDVYSQLLACEESEVSDETLIRGLFSKCDGLIIVVVTLGESGSIFVRVLTNRFREFERREMLRLNVLTRSRLKMWLIRRVRAIRSWDSY